MKSTYLTIIFTLTIIIFYALFYITKKEIFLWIFIIEWIFFTLYGFYLILKSIKL